MRLLLYIRNRKTKWAKSILSAVVVFFFAFEVGYPMQPPPSPLNLTQFRKLISEADVIAVGKIDSVKETESLNGVEMKRTVEATLSIEELLKGKVTGKTIVIKETYPTSNSPTLGLVPRDEGKSRKTITVIRVGPSRYHGRYRQGALIIVLLAKIKGTDVYKPMGSGTYDKHLCEFLIESAGIKMLYFRFADDVGKHAGSKEQFIGLIRKLRDSEEEDK